MELVQIGPGRIWDRQCADVTGYDKHRVVMVHHATSAVVAAAQEIDLLLADRLLRKSLTYSGCCSVYK